MRTKIIIAIQVLILLLSTTFQSISLLANTKEIKDENLTHFNRPDMDKNSNKNSNTSFSSDKTKRTKSKSKSKSKYSSLPKVTNIRESFWNQKPDNKESITTNEGTNSDGSIWYKQETKKEDTTISGGKDTEGNVWFKIESEI